jgi:truncated hemoglobin YjbI
MDDQLGPIFAAARVDWPSHIERITDFWCWQLLAERCYDGNPLRAHEPAHRRTPFHDEHFARWLELFTDSVDQSFGGPIADEAKIRATKMASALRRLLRARDSDTTVSVVGDIAAPLRPPPCVPERALSRDQGSVTNCPRKSRADVVSSR